MGVVASTAAGRRAQQSIHGYDVPTIITEAQLRSFPVAVDSGQCSDVLAALGMEQSLAEDLWMLCMPRSSGADADEKSTDMLTVQEMLTTIVLVSSVALEDKLVNLCRIFSPYALEREDPTLLELHYDDVFVLAYTVLRATLLVLGDGTADDSTELRRISESMTDDVFVAARKTMEEHVNFTDLVQWAKVRAVDQRAGIRNLDELNSVLPFGIKFDVATEKWRK